MTKHTATNLFAGAIVLAGGLALARPAAADQTVEPCAESHEVSIIEGREFCSGAGYNYVTVTTRCYAGTAVETTIRCHN